MTSRFVGRDYSTLRSEIIDFLRKRLPQSWDYTNLADPVVIFAESLARVGDQLHYTIDELRRECDVATARRASSIYSYAMREGYKMMLPKGANGTISVNSTKEQSDRMILRLKQFDEIKVGQTGLSLFVATEDNTDEGSSSKGYAINSALHEPPDEEYMSTLDRWDYAAYANEIFKRTQRFNVVLGKKETFNFTYNDINSDSTVTIPDPIIDRDLVRLRISDDNHNESNELMTYVDDIISSGFVGDLFTLTPKFIGGAITLNIEFPTDYKTMFTKNATFSFEYIKIQNGSVGVEEASIIDLSPFIVPAEGLSEDDIDPATYIEDGEQHVGGVIIDLNNGIKGYREYEDSTTTRENYKNFIQDYGALLTKNDYASYCKIATNSYCKVYDHSDNYKVGVLPPNTELIPRIIYILTDAPYKERERLWNDLIERSSRSDVIMLMPYGKDPYTIIVKAECFLMGTSISAISTQIKSELLQYYSGNTGEKIPEVSMINYLTHKASDKVIRMDSVIIRDSTFGEKEGDKYVINQDFADASKLSNDDVDALFDAIKYGNTSINVNNNPYRLVGLDSDGNAYNKYPVVTYKPFPEAFPEIYLDGAEKPLRGADAYNEIVKWQASYGHFDSSDWDFSDDKLFVPKRDNIDDSVPSPDTNVKDFNLQPGDFLTSSFTVDNPDNANHWVRPIDPSYIKHHYMVPVLNRVVVLIKSIGN